MKKTVISEYDQKAIDFLQASAVTINFKKAGHDKYFDDDKQSRDIWRVELVKIGDVKNATQVYSFRFGQSIANQGKTPTAYGVLSCLTKYDPGTIFDFCSNYGYDDDSIKANKIYKDVVIEWENVRRMFTPEQIEQLQEIQ